MSIDCHVSSTSSISSISDDELEARLRDLVRKNNELTAELLSHLAELDRRKLYARWACSSLHAYCTTRLGLSDAAAYKRITAARAARRYPVILERIRTGRNHLSAVVMLARYLTVENHEELLTAAERLSKPQLEKLIALRFPRPDAPDAIRRLPVTHQATTAAYSRSLPEPTRGTLVPLGPMSMPSNEERTLESLAPTASVSVAAARPDASATDTGVGAATDDARSIDGTAPTSGTPGDPRRRESTDVAASSMPELPPARYKVQFTATQALHDKIEQARALLSHELPDRELAALFDRALDLLIADLLKKKYGIGAKRRGQKRTDRKQPRPAGDSCSETAGAVSEMNRHVPASVRRFVAQRDELRCAFVDSEGNRCPERRFLELQHHHPHALGGPATIENLSLWCRTHNRADAREKFGVAHIERAIARRRASESRDTTRPGAST